MCYHPLAMICHGHITANEQRTAMEGAKRSGEGFPLKNWRIEPWNYAMEAPVSDPARQRPLQRAEAVLGAPIHGKLGIIVVCAELNTSNESYGQGRSR